MSRFLRLALLLSAAPLASRLFAQAPPFGGEFQVNTYTTGDQDFPVVAVAPDGQFIIAWQSQGQDGSAKASSPRSTTPAASRAGRRSR